MLDLKSKIENKFGYDNIVIEIPKDSKMGDLSVPCFGLKSETEKNPLDIANKISAFIKDFDYIEDVKTVGAFVNIFIKTEYLANELLLNVINNNYFDSFNIGNNEKLLIEHTSINPNASPHVGRARNSILSDTLVRIMKYAKYDVEVNYFVNDIGKQIAYLVVAFDELETDSIEFDEILKMYVDINKRSETDSSITEKAYKYLNKLENGNLEVKEKFNKIARLCVEGQKKIFDSLNIKFDVFTYESDYVFKNKIDEVLSKLKEKDKLFEDENGRLCVDLDGYNIPTKSPVLVLTRSDKTSLYPIRDIAYTIDKIKKVSENNFIVLGEDQKTYMLQIQAVLDILGYNSPELISYSFITLNGDSMGTRTGNFVLLEDLIAEISNKLKIEFDKREDDVSDEKLNKLANAVIKYSILNTSKDKTINFNIESTINFTGNTAVYLIYNSVRIKSILSKVEIDMDKIDMKSLVDIHEKEIIKKMYFFNDTVANTLNKKDPVILCNYIYDLVNTFSKYYSSVNILNENDEITKNSRLLLIKALDLIIEKAFHLIGFEKIEQL